MIEKILAWLGFASPWTSTRKRCAECGTVFTEEGVATSYGCNNCPECGKFIPCPKCADRHYRAHRKSSN